jgi:hypothetical protein
MEVIDIGLNDLEPITLDFDDSKSLNLGGSSSGSQFGIELLMNDKKRGGSGGTTTIDLGDLDNLENELNELSGSKSASSESSSASSSASSSTSSSAGSSNTKTLSGLASDFFGFSKAPTETGSGPSVSFADDTKTDSKVGSATVDSMGSAKTWDGFSKMNEMPSHNAGSDSSRMSEREKRRKKRAMIKKLEEWHDKGLLKSSSRFTMDSNYEEVEDEYETALEDKRKKDGVKLQGWWFTTFVNTIEYANTAFNPFDINLDGWGEQVSEDLESYDEIFGELYEKYKGGKMAPELSLLLRLGFSASVVHFTNKALSSSVPGFNDVIRQSPELMRAFTNATVNTMSQSSPGFAFANTLMQEQGNKPRGPPPPMPVETKNQPPPHRPGSMVFTDPRNDIQAARGTMFRESGVDMNQPGISVNQSQPPVPAFQNMALPPQPPKPEQQPTTLRPEMRGPQNTDIDDILAGLKPRSVAMSTPTEENDSMISVTSLKDMQNSSMPKRSRRKQRSDKNTISLDI